MPDPSPKGPFPEVEGEADSEAVARAIVLRQLTLGPRTRQQLARKLAERNVPEDVAVVILRRFEDVGLIDDAEFAKMWVRSRSASKSLARNALRRELHEKGVQGEDAESALAMLSDEEEADTARCLLQRRIRSFDRGDRDARQRELRRLGNLLARKGYSPGQAFSLAAEAVEVAEETAEGIIRETGFSDGEEGV